MKPVKSANTIWHPVAVNRAMREQRNGHRAALLWFTGLSGSGKSTVAHAVEAELFAQGLYGYVFDGDNVRHGLCGDLGFSTGDREENIRRIGEACRLFLDAGIISLAAFISPFRRDREWVRQRVGPGDFLEIYCRCPLGVCEARDVKGLYRRARRGEIQNYTGISSPYEEPEKPDLVLDTAESSLEFCVQQVLDLMARRGIGIR